MASAMSPTSTAAELPKVTCGRSLASTLINAISVWESVPITRAFISRLSDIETFSSVAPSTTWLLVTIYPSALTMTPDPSPCWRSGRSGIRKPKPGNRSSKGLSERPDVRITRVDEMLTTAGKTALTTGANVAGIVTASRTAGAAAATADAGAWPAWIIEEPTKAPPAMAPMLSMSAAMTHTGYLLIRFIVVFSLDNSIFLNKDTIEIRRTNLHFVTTELRVSAGRDDQLECFPWTTT